MLGGKYFGRCHHTGLAMVIDSQQHGEQCYQCLSASHITLQKTVHLSPASHIGTDFLDDSFLCSGQFKRKILFIECIEVVSDGRENDSFQFQFPKTGRTKDVQLYKKKFVELQA